MDKLPTQADECQSQTLLEFRVVFARYSKTFFLLYRSFVWRKKPWRGSEMSRASTQRRIFPQMFSICNISRYPAQNSSKSCPVGSATNNLITPRALSSISRPTLPAMKSSSKEPHRTLTTCSTPSSGCLVHMPVKFVEYSWINLWDMFYTKTTTSYQTIAAFNAKSKNEYVNSNYEIMLENYQTRSMVVLCKVK